MERMKSDTLVFESLDLVQTKPNDFRQLLFDISESAAVT